MSNPINPKIAEMLRKELARKGHPVKSERGFAIAINSLSKEDNS
jgi:hypothetical protein